MSGNVRLVYSSLNPGFKRDHIKCLSRLKISAHQPVWPLSPPRGAGLSPLGVDPVPACAFVSFPSGLSGATSPYW